VHWQNFGRTRNPSKTHSPSTNRKHESDCRVEASFRKHPNLTRVLFPFRSSRGMHHRREGNTVTRPYLKGKSPFGSFSFLLQHAPLLKFREFAITGFYAFFKTTNVLKKIAISRTFKCRRNRRNNFGGQCRGILTFHQMWDCYYLLPAATDNQYYRAQKQEA
jgi:hypothetical protein